MHPNCTINGEKVEWFKRKEEGILKKNILHHLAIQSHRKTQISPLEQK